jgi:hypothetical protein
LGASVGGRVSQTRGVTFSAPNSTVLFRGISRWEIRPVTLSSAANTAIGFLTISACAGSIMALVASARGAKSRKTAPPGRQARKFSLLFMPHTL